MQFGGRGCGEIVRTGVDGAAEVGDVFVVAVGQAALLHQFSELFHKVEIGALGGREEQFDVEFGGFCADR